MSTTEGDLTLEYNLYAYLSTCTIRIVSLEPTSIPMVNFNKI